MMDHYEWLKSQYVAIAQDRFGIADQTAQNVVYNCANLDFKAAARSIWSVWSSEGMLDGKKVAGEDLPTADHIREWWASARADESTGFTVVYASWSSGDGKRLHVFQDSSEDEIAIFAHGYGWEEGETVSLPETVEWSDVRGFIIPELADKPGFDRARAKGVLSLRGVQALGVAA